MILNHGKCIGKYQPNNDDIFETEYSYEFILYSNGKIFEITAGIRVVVTID